MMIGVLGFALNQTQIIPAGGQRGIVRDLVDEKGFEPSASSLRKQTVKLDGEEPSEAELEREEGPTNSGICD
jgi:hypothetical protein